ncbi:MAG: hypothetical protein WBN08_03265 [Thiogranum sp.]
MAESGQRSDCEQTADAGLEHRRQGLTGSLAMQQSWTVAFTRMLTRGHTTLYGQYRTGYPIRLRTRPKRGLPRSHPALFHCAPADVTH